MRPSSAVEIGALREEDVPRLVAIVQSTRAFRDDEVEVARELLEAGAQKGEASDYLFRVAREFCSAAQTPVGYACYGPTPCTEGTFDLYWIAVAPSRQNSGVASSLLSAAEEDIRARRGRLLIAETEESEAYGPAKKFYETRGFRLAARIEDFYRPGCAQLVYIKPLTSPRATGGH